MRNFTATLNRLREIRRRIAEKTYETQDKIEATAEGVRRTLDPRDRITAKNFPLYTGDVT